MSMPRRLSVPVLALALASSAALTGCTAAVPAAETTRTETPAPEVHPAADALARVTPEQVDSAVADLPEAVRAAMEATGTPGVAVGVVYDGEVLFAEGFGTRNLDTDEPVDSATVFPLASVSKSLAATVVARAIDEGIVEWDTPVAENLEGFTLSDPYVGANVTIADMFSHRSGLYLHAGDELEEIGYDRAAVLERLRYVPLNEWRADYAYGNFDITAAGESVARAAGEDWESLSDRLLYEPLGMESTSSRYSDLEARDDRAVGHMKIDGEWAVTPEQRQPDQQAPAGGASSNIDDMLVWTRMMLDDGESEGEPFVAVESIEPAMSPQMITGAPPVWGGRAGTYGYGFNVGTTPGGLVDVNHSGAFQLGTGTVVKMLPGVDLGIVVLSNGAANGVVEGIASRFTDLAQFGEERRDWLTFWPGVFEGMAQQELGELAGQEKPGDPAPADLSAYTGEYANEYFGPARVTASGDALTLFLGPTGEWPLEHWSGDVFVFRPTGENANAGTVSQATFDGDTLVLEYFDPHGLGTFTR